MDVAVALGLEGVHIGPELAKGDFLGDAFLFLFRPKLASLGPGDDPVSRVEEGCSQKQAGQEEGGGSPPIPDGSGFGFLFGSQALGGFFENRPLSLDQGRANSFGGGFFRESQLSGGHLKYPVSEGGELVAMSNGEDGKFPFVPKFTHDCENFFLGQWVKVAGGFVQQQKSGFMLEGACERDSALLATGKFIGKGIPTVPHPQTGEKFLGAGIGLMLGFTGQQSGKGSII